MSDQESVQNQKKVRVRRSPERIVELVLEAERTGNIAELCRREGIAPTQFYGWRKKFKIGGIEGLKWSKRGPKKAVVDPAEHEQMKAELAETKEALVRASIELSLLKKSVSSGSRGR